MILKFTNPDMLNTTLIDVSTGLLAYDIFTAPAISKNSNNSEDTLLPVNETDASGHPQDLLRRTWIYDGNGNLVAEIGWRGRRPQDIVLGDEKIEGLTELFESSSVEFLPKSLLIPSRFDTEQIWTATADSLTLFDYDSEETKGCFHRKSIRLGDRFIDTHLSGLGHKYLEFQPHPLAMTVEIVVSFLMMEILRRGRFSLTPYTFERPKLSQLRGARDSLFRTLSLRRHSV